MQRPTRRGPQQSGTPTDRRHERRFFRRALFLATIHTCRATPRHHDNRPSLMTTQLSRRFNAQQLTFALSTWRMDRERERDNRRLCEYAAFLSKQINRGGATNGGTHSQAFFEMKNNSLPGDRHVPACLLADAAWHCPRGWSWYKQHSQTKTMSAGAVFFFRARELRGSTTGVCDDGRPTATGGGPRASPVDHENKNAHPTIVLL
jgi:hypothetical protein